MIERNFQVNSLMRFVEIPVQGRDNPHRQGFRTIAPSPITLTFLPSGSDQWSTAVTASAQWLPWDSGFITETALVGRDVFSGPFSGCWMVAYRDRPMTYVGHIGTDVGRPNKDVKRAWHRFAAANADDVITAVNPIRDYTGPLQPILGRDTVPKCFGLVTADCTCYIIMTFLQNGVGPPTLRIAGIQRAFGKLPKAARDIFRDDPDVHDIGLPFTLNDWKTTTTGGVFHTRSTQLKNLDTVLASYFQNPCVPTLNNVRIAFNTWRTEKMSEYQNPIRDRRNCIHELENYLTANT